MCDTLCYGSRRIAILLRTRKAEQRLGHRLQSRKRDLTAVADAVPLGSFLDADQDVVQSFQMGGQQDHLLST